MLRLLLLSIFLVTTLITHLLGQNLHSVSVVDSKNNPIEFAMITSLRGYPGCYTDYSGRFDISLFEGTDSVLVSHIGFKSVRLSTSKLQKQTTITLNQCEEFLNSFEINELSGFKSRTKTGHLNKKSNYTFNAHYGHTIVRLMKSSMIEYGLVNEIKINIYNNSNNTQKIRIVAFDGEYDPEGNYIPGNISYSSPSPIEVNRRKNRLKLMNLAIPYQSPGIFIGYELLNNEPQNTGQPFITSPLGHSEIEYLTWIKRYGTDWHQLRLPRLTLDGKMRANIMLEASIKHD